MSDETPNLIFIAAKKMQFRTHVGKQAMAPTSQDRPETPLSPLLDLAQTGTLKNHKSPHFSFFKKQHY